MPLLGITVGVPVTRMVQVQGGVSLAGDLCARVSQVPGAVGLVGRCDWRSW